MLSPSHPTHFKAAQATAAAEDFVLNNVEWKDPRNGEVVVKVIACGVCHSDSATKFQIMKSTLPRTPGHEIVGDVVAVGPGEKRWKFGDRVGSGWHGGHCGICSSCRKGDFVTCFNQNINGVFSDGGYAEYAVLRTEALVAIPEGMDPYEAAPLLCDGVTTFNSVRNSCVRAGDVVAVQGIGGLGHLALQFCRQMGFRTVALSSSTSKKALALEIGGHDSLDGSKIDQAAELQKMGGAKVILATAPNPKIIETLIAGLAVGGQLVHLAAAESLTVPIAPMIHRRLSIVGWPSGSAQDSEDTLNFAKICGLKCRIEKYKLAEVNEAFEAMMEGKTRFRAVLALH